MSSAALLGLTVAYMGVLFWIASVVDRSRGLARSLARHPLTHALALGVYATAWTLFGSVWFAAKHGYRFLAIQIGATISCALIPLIWGPLARLCRERQLASVADLLAYRYDSPTVGTLVTLFFLAGSLPYQALQLRASVESVAVLSDADSRGLVAVVLTLLFVGFALVYGIRHLTPFTRHDGFVAALAVESLVKLAAMLAAAGYSVFAVLGGIDGLSRFLAARPEAVAALVEADRGQSWLALVLLASTSVFLSPRQWHIGITEGSAAGLRISTWALPCYLLALNSCIPFVLWAARALELPGSEEFYLLGLSADSGSTTLSIAVFLGALSASSAMICVTTVALASMLQNHVVLPSMNVLGGNLYRRLHWLRRGLVIGIIVAGYGVYLLLARGPRLVDMGLCSFMAVAQVVPALFGVLVWSGATARGVIWGLVAGILAWVATPLVPLLAEAGVLPARWNWLALLDLPDEPWSFTTAFTLGINTIAFVIGSLSRAPTRSERKLSAICRRKDELLDHELVELGSADDFEARLRPVLGDTAAAHEVDDALARLGLPRDAHRPDQLRAVREQLEKNLSGLVGPVMARRIVDENLAFEKSVNVVISTLLRSIDERFSTTRWEGPALAVEHARRFLRDVIEDLPIGVCALGPAGDVAVWNRAMAEVTAVTARDAVGRTLGDLPEPWARAFARLIGGRVPRGEIAAEIRGRKRTILLERAVNAQPLTGGGFVIIAEDCTVDLA